MSRTALRLRMGGALSAVLNVLFLIGIAGQTGAGVWLQLSRLRGRLAQGQVDGASAQVAALLFMDVLGMLLLLPGAMIRADGIGGRQRAAVDTELWLTLPLEGPQRVLARLGQATFLLTVLGFFLLSHFLGPALAFGRGPVSTALLFLCTTSAALALILGGGAALYALVRRYLPASAQGRLIAWNSLGMIPLIYVMMAVLTGKGGAPAERLGALLFHTPLAVLLRAVQRGDVPGALRSGALLWFGAALLAYGGWRLCARLHLEAVDDLAPLGTTRRYPTAPGERRPLSPLAKDLRLLWRDPMQRGALLGSVLLSLLVVGTDRLGGLPGTGISRPAPLLALGCYSIGLLTILQAMQWLPLEARALDFLRATGVEAPGLLRRKGLCASVAALLLSTPTAAYLFWKGGLGLLPQIGLILLVAVGLAWFVVGDTAARFPEARRDTRPVQVRTLYASYLVLMGVVVILQISWPAALAALALLALAALGRVDAGIDALTDLDDVQDRPLRVRFADAWIAGGAGVLTQGLVAVALSQGLRVNLTLAALAAYCASAALLGLWTVSYLRRRLPAEAPTLLWGAPGTRRLLLGVGLGALSATVAGAYLWVLLKLGVGAAQLPGTAALGQGPLWQRALVALVLVGLDPLAEELFFRGWILRGLQERFPRGGLALWLQALLFMLLHPALSYLPVLVLGLCTGLLVRRTGSLWPAVLCHAVHNAVPALLLLIR